MKKREYAILEWDTNAFGYKVAQITQRKLSEQKLRNLLNELKENKVRLVYWFVDPGAKESNRAARKVGGFLADEKVTYLADIPLELKDYKKPKEIKLYMGKRVTKKLEQLALEAGAYSRFKIDPNFGSREFEYVYKSWIRNSLRGNLAFETLVYKKGKRIIGFVTIGEKRQRANIGLTVVDANYRRKGIGTQLMEAAQSRAREKGFKKIQVVTQKANRQACNFYEKLGFKVESISNVYHFWLDGKKKN